MTHPSPKQEMKEKPIIFSGEMVRAILHGSKTQTRRTTGLNEVNRIPDGWTFQKFENGVAWFRRDFGECWSEKIKCPFGQPGDFLWVRESFWERNDHLPKVQDMNAILFEKPEEERSYFYKRKSPLHMPRWASRITLEITDIRVERLQDISEEDAEAEGATYWWDGITREDQERIYEGGRGAIAAFRCLWNSIHGEGAWDLNSWVWVIKFRKV